jgi:hypothetical protein
MRLWVEPAGREWKSADVEWKMVTLIYPYWAKHFGATRHLQEKRLMTLAPGFLLHWHNNNESITGTNKKRVLSLVKFLLNLTP